MRIAVVLFQGMWRMLGQGGRLCHEVTSLASPGLAWLFLAGITVSVRRSARIDEGNNKLTVIKEKDITTWPDIS